MINAHLSASVRLLLVLLSIFQLSACASKSSVDLIVHSAVIIDTRSGEHHTGKAVVIDGGIIQDIVPMAQIDEFDADQTVNGNNGFLIPALGDAHVHIGHSSDLQHYVRYGVGLVVNMSGSALHLELRESIRRGDLAGPAIVTMGPTLDGTDPTNPLFVSVSPQSSGQVIDWIAEQGYDAIKVYQQMDASTLSSIVRNAQTRNMITAGHVSRTTGIDSALVAGLRFVAHGEELAFEAYDESSRRYDQSTIPALADRLVSDGVTVTPMINYLENIPNQALDLNNFLSADAMSLLPAYMRQSYGPRQGWFSNRDKPEQFAAQISSLKDFVMVLTGALNERNGSLILGTDAGFGGAIPGLSVHDELQTLVHAGLSPLEALQTATLNIGKFVRQVDSTHTLYGVIEAGYAGSVLLLDSDPLQNISATRQINGLAIDGRWRAMDDLTALDRKLRQQQTEVLPLAESFETAILEGDLERARNLINTLSSTHPDQTLIGADNCIFMGYRHYYGGRRELAGKFYELCAHMNPHSSPLWIHIARALESTNDFDGALEAYRQALDINPWYGDPAEAISRLHSRTTQRE